MDSRDYVAVESGGAEAAYGTIESDPLTMMEN
jgi:hypothetical protein